MSALTKDQRPYPGKVGDRSAYKFLPLVELSTAREGILQCLMHRWWAVTDEGALLFRGLSPQCNRHREIAERVCPPWARLEFVAMAFLPHECEP